MAEWSTHKKTCTSCHNYRYYDEWLPPMLLSMFHHMVSYVMQKIFF